MKEEEIAPEELSLEKIKKILGIKVVDLQLWEITSLGDGLAFYYGPRIEVQSVSGLAFYHSVVNFSQGIIELKKRYPTNKL